MEIFIIAVIIGLIPAAIASSKGHSFFPWWLYGATLFIVALPHSILIKPDKSSVLKRKVDEGMRKCPQCANWVMQEAIKCQYCGSELEPLPRKE